MEADTFSARLRQLRGDLSVRELARRANCGKSTISDLESERRSPTPRMAAALDRALGADGTLAVLAHPAAHDPLPDEELFDVWRRDFLKTALAAGTAVGLPADTGASSRELISAHIALRAAHGRLDNLRGARAVYAQAADHHQQILAWHATVRSAGDRQRIAALAADTGGFVGFLTYDLGMADAAVTYYRNAAVHARQVNDLSCCTNLIGQMSRIRADQGDFRGALSLSDHAVDLAGTQAHPAVRSWLHAVRAHHHSGLGDARAARADLHAAWTLLDRADDGEKPPYIGYLDGAELGKWTGHAMIRLSQTTPGYVKTGVNALDQARAHWPAASVRGSAEVFTASARLHAATGERDRAVDLLSRSIAVATATGSARNLRAALATQSLLTTGS
jgi:transcriptional regulator with XRE-family HTH domain